MFKYQVEPTLDALVRDIARSDMYAAQARQDAADADAAIACETMRHAVISAHQNAGAFEVEHVSLAVSRGHVICMTWDRNGCDSWRRPIADNMTLFHT